MKSLPKIYWYALLLLCCVLIVVGGLLFSSPSVLYINILSGLFPSLIAMGISIPLFFSTRASFFRKKHPASNAGNNIEFLFFKLIAIIFFLAGIYSAGPIVNGIFEKFILNKPYEFVQGTVVYIDSHAARNRIYNSTTECVFWWSCNFKLDNNPNRIFNYPEPRSLSIGDNVELTVLPGSDLVLEANTIP